MDNSRSDGLLALKLIAEERSFSSAAKRLFLELGKLSGKLTGSLRRTEEAEPFLAQAAPCIGPPKFKF